MKLIRDLGLPAVGAVAAAIIMLGPSAGAPTASADLTKQGSAAAHRLTLVQLNQRYPASQRAPFKLTPRLADGAAIAAMPDLLAQNGIAVVREFASASNLSASQITIKTLTAAQDQATNSFIYQSGSVVAESPAVGDPLNADTPVVLTVTP